MHFSGSHEFFHSVAVSSNPYPGVWHTEVWSLLDSGGREEGLVDSGGEDTEETLRKPTESSSSKGM